MNEHDMNNLSQRQQDIYAIVQRFGPINNKRILQALNSFGRPVSRPTLSRDLAEMVQSETITPTGAGRSVQYHITKTHSLLKPISVESYFHIDNVQNRHKQFTFDNTIFEDLADLFTVEEQEYIRRIHHQYTSHIEQQSLDTIQKFFRTIADCMSTAVEAEAVEAKQIHQALGYIRQFPAQFSSLNPLSLEHLYTAFTKLEESNDQHQNTSKNREESATESSSDTHATVQLRTQSSGIPGTFYSVPVGEVLAASLQRTCEVIQDTENIYEKAFIAYALLPVLQPFQSANTHLGLLLTNAILIAQNGLPLHFHTFNSFNFLRAQILFVEQRSLDSLKSDFFLQLHESSKKIKQESAVSS